MEFKISYEILTTIIKAARAPRGRKESVCVKKRKRECVRGGRKRVCERGEEKRVC